MLKKTLLFSLMVMLGASFPALRDAGWFSGVLDANKAEAVVEPETTLSRLETPQGRPASGQVSLRADDRGHFIGSFDLNGRRVKAMVDTGASVVAINRSQAKRLGIVLTQKDFSRNVGTANGNVKAAPVILSEVEIGRIRVRDVEAVVLEDSSLSGALIGMSFLRQLKAVEVRDKTLYLSQ